MASNFANFMVFYKLSDSSRRFAGTKKYSGQQKKNFRQPETHNFRVSRLRELVGRKISQCLNKNQGDDNQTIGSSYRL